MIVIVVLSIQQNIVDLVKKDRCNLSSDMWNIFSMFQSPIFGNSSLTLSVFVIFIWPLWRRVRTTENIEMTNACFVIFCRAKLWLNMNRYAQGIYVCETNSKMEFFTARCTQNTLLLYNNIKIPRNTKKNSFAATETDDVFSCLLFLDNSPPASFCVCSGSAMDPFVCCVKLKQRKLNVRGCQDPGAIVLIN